MLETCDNFSTSCFNLECPQPIRPTSPVGMNDKWKRKSGSWTENTFSDWEANQEIQQILLNQFSDHSISGSVPPQSPFEPVEYEQADNCFGAELGSLFDETNETALFSSLPRRSPPVLKRPKLGNSSTSVNSCVGPIPPMRVHNPLPMNSLFVNRGKVEGVEFGLLSVSPVPEDDNDRCSRVQRVMARKNHQVQNNPLL